jgi:sodium pump decarboxylase gamma subunit
MIFEGLKLTLLGMGVVFAFLGLLIVVIKLNRRVLKPLTDKEQAAHHAMSHKKKGPRHHQELEEKQRILAVISATIAAHRARDGVAQRGAAKPVEDQPHIHSPKHGHPPQLLAGTKRRPPSLTRLLFRDRATFLSFRRFKNHKLHH